MQIEPMQKTGKEDGGSKMHKIARKQFWNNGKSIKTVGNRDVNDDESELRNNYKNCRQETTVVFGM